MRLETFFKKFDQFAGAPDAVAKMRALILRIAMQGMLSESCGSDQSVSDLLSEVEREKQRLGIRSSTKVTSEDPDFLANETAQAIPARWALVRFGDIARYNAGKTLDKGRNRGELRDYITTSNLYWGFFRLDSVRQMPLQEAELERCTAAKGDLLICEGGEAGRAAVWPHDHEIAFQNHVHRARFFAGIDAYFVQRYFEKLNATGEIENYRKGVGISNISGKALASIPIPLPPLAEQKRIVAKVNELMALCDLLDAQQQERDTRHAALARASLARFADAPTPDNLQFLFHKSYDIDPADLRKSILTLAVQGKLVPQDPNDEDSEVLVRKIAEATRDLVNAGSMRSLKSLSAVTDNEMRFSLPAGWVWARLQEVIDVRDGTHDSPKDCIGPDTFPLITSRNFENGDINFESARRISAKDHFEIQKRSKIEKDDILFSMIGGNIGNQVIVKTDAPFSVKNVALFKYYDRALTYPPFIKRYMEHLAVRLQQEAIGGAQPFVSLGYLRKLPIALPPTAEQRRIVAKVDQLMVLVEELETQIAASRATARNLLDALVAELTAAGASSPKWRLADEAPPRRDARNVVMRQ